MPGILIVGYDEYQSGKTILAGSIVSILRSRGIDAVGVKPLAGVDAWEYPWILNEIRERRIVIGGDALKLFEASNGVESLEAISPQTLIMAPRDPSKTLWRLSSPDAREAVLGRVSVCREGRVDTLHFINIDGLNKIPNGVASAILEVAGRLQPLPLRADRTLIDKVVSGGFIVEVETCMARIASRHEFIVYESNSDIAMPTPSAQGVDWVIAVSHGVAGVVEGDRWAKAVEVLAGAGGVRGLTTREVVALTGIRESFQLPFLHDPIEGYKERDLDPLLDYILTKRSERD